MTIKLSRPRNHQSKRPSAVRNQPGELGRRRCAVGRFSRVQTFGKKFQSHFRLAFQTPSVRAQETCSEFDALPPLPAQKANLFLTMIYFPAEMSAFVRLFCALKKGTSWLETSLSIEAIPSCQRLRFLSLAHPHAPHTNFSDQRGAPCGWADRFATSSTSFEREFPRSSSAPFPTIDYYRPIDHTASRDCIHVDASSGTIRSDRTSAASP